MAGVEVAREPLSVLVATGTGTVSVAPASEMIVEEKTRPPAEDGTDGIGGMTALPEAWPPEDAEDAPAAAAAVLDDRTEAAELAETDTVVGPDTVARVVGALLARGDDETAGEAGACEEA